MYSFESNIYHLLFKQQLANTRIQSGSVAATRILIEKWWAVWYGIPTLSKDERVNKYMQVMIGMCYEQIDWKFKCQTESLYFDWEIVLLTLCGMSSRFYCVLSSLRLLTHNEQLSFLLLYVIYNFLISR
jgi:hypothetical protein